MCIQNDSRILYSVAHLSVLFKHISLNIRLNFRQQSPFSEANSRSAGRYVFYWTSLPRLQEPEI
jgi:hypothetical protein